LEAGWSQSWRWDVKKTAGVTYSSLAKNAPILR
jgi:hypothetical protein